MKVHELNESSTQIQDLELLLAKESRQRHETDRALKKQLMKTQESEASFIANSMRRQTPQESFAIPPQTSSSIGIGNVSSLDIMRSLSAQRSRPSASATAAASAASASSSGASNHPSSTSAMNAMTRRERDLGLATSSRLSSAPASTGTSTGHSRSQSMHHGSSVASSATNSAPSLISEDTRRTVQELLRIQKGTYPGNNSSGNDGHAATHRPPVSSAANRVETSKVRAFFDDDNGNLSNISMVSNNSLYSNSNASFVQRRNNNHANFGEDNNRFKLRDLT
jgi:hypothetical protein